MSDHTVSTAAIAGRRPRGRGPRVRFDPMEVYMLEIGRVPLLTREEESALVCLAHDGDRDAIDRLILCNLRLVVCIAKGFRGRGVDLPDLIQNGYFGVCRAAEKFDPAAGTRFSTYATHWIRQAIWRGIVGTAEIGGAGVIRVPHHAWEAASKRRRGRQLLPEKEAWADRAERSRAVETLDVDDPACSWHLVDERADHPVLALMLAEDCGAIVAALDDLADSSPVLPTHEARMKAEKDRKAAKVLRMRYGLAGGAGRDGFQMTLEEIGQVMNVTRETIRILEAWGLKRMREMLVIER